MLLSVLPGYLTGLLSESTGAGSPFVYPILFTIIFLENGVLPMVWLPGDSLLFLSGILAAGTVLDLSGLLITYVVAAFLGYQLNYILGRNLGFPLIYRHFSGTITERHLEKSRDFYRRWGNLAITIGRFVPVIRTIIPFLAGISHMNVRSFTVYNILGALLWPSVVCGFGYLCGILPWIDAYREGILLLVSALFTLGILGSVILVVTSLVRTR